VGWSKSAIFVYFGHETGTHVQLEHTSYGVNSFHLMFASLKLTRDVGYCTVGDPVKLDNNVTYTSSRTLHCDCGNNNG